MSPGRSGIRSAEYSAWKVRPISPRPVECRLVRVAREHVAHRDHQRLLVERGDKGVEAAGQVGIGRSASVVSRTGVEQLVE